MMIPMMQAVRKMMMTMTHPNRKDQEKSASMWCSLWSTSSHCPCEMAMQTISQNRTAIRAARFMWLMRSIMGIFRVSSTIRANQTCLSKQFTLAMISGFRGWDFSPVNRSKLDKSSQSTTDMKLRMVMVSNACADRKTAKGDWLRNLRSQTRDIV